MKKMTFKALVLMTLSLVLASCGGEKKPKVPNNIIDGHRYVDLGLSVKWADRNIGAHDHTGYGDYYKWGDKEEHGVFSSFTYEKCEKVIAGDTLYDVVRAKWGGRWRLPLCTEFEELINQCTWKATMQNDVYGAVVTGPNGNSIFLPFGGYKDSRESSLYSIMETMKGEKSLDEIREEEKRLCSKEEGQSGYYLTATPFDKAYMLNKYPYYKNTNAGRQEFEKFEEMADKFFMTGKATSVGGEIYVDMKGYGYSVRGVIE